MPDYHYVDVDRSEMIPFVPVGARRVLDVGCGYGAFGAALKAARPDIVVWGIEPAVEPAGHAASRLDQVVVGSYPDDLSPEERFDCIVFNDVLEHVVDPWAVLQRTLPHLRPGGRVVASVPNVRHWSVIWSLARAGRWTYRDAGILDRTHLRFFTRSTMIELFADSGYHVEQVAPIHEAVRGHVGRLVALLGARTEEFRTVQYGLRAAPAGSPTLPRVREGGDPALGVVMIHWEAPDWCRDAVAAFLTSEGIRPAITVVDNGGGPLELPEAVRVLTPAANTGFAGGGNLGLRDWLAHDDTEYCVVASHDCHPEPDALAHLVTAADAHQDLGLLAPAFTDGEYGGKVRGRRPGIVEKEWLSGSCLLVRRRCVEEIGLFDERMGSYSEDADLSLRAWDAGWSVGVVEAARASTRGSRLSIVERRRLGETNAIYLLLKRRAWTGAVGKVAAQLPAAARHALLGARPAERGRVHRQ
ncbi:MAG: methyltransferase domain-containing protein, partial [Acidimicrobiia bacterium]|nr:methyltransferase domain-containing protein [Acidimicrobiia bacterium]